VAQPASIRPRPIVARAAGLEIKCKLINFI
jgi:hypothetical protein